MNNSSRNIAFIRRVLPSNSSTSGGAADVRRERSLHAISNSSTMDYLRNESLIPLIPPPPSSSSSSSQSRPFFGATPSSAMEAHSQLVASPCRKKPPSSKAIHRLLSNIGAPTSLRNIECIMQEVGKRDDDSDSHDEKMTADEIINLIAQIRSI